ncbi:hypothetical protein AVEN_57528-1 [Araneus ventricosus]|uniref:Uncharacterized protein n=1 Tax=Araneus ventricosus TaxID=182803 RepID=A0A4Y2VZ66_ARAVE|nr:hypothetical protein AVEN_57528-1 [Araneus ventricosus]
MTAGTVRILRKPSFFPNPSGRATLTKKECAAGEKSITLNEGVEISETAIVFCMKRRLGRSRIDRVNDSIENKDRGPGNLVVRCWPQSRRVPGSKPDSTEDLPCILACCALNHTQRVKLPPAVVAEKFGEGVPAQVPPRYLTAARSDEVRRKIALVLRPNKTLI